MIASDDQERRLMKFSGKYKDWSFQEEKCLVWGTQKGFEDALKGIIKVAPESEILDLQMDARRERKMSQEKIKLGYKEPSRRMDTMQELQKRRLWLARYGQKSEFTRREAMERWRDPEEKPLDKNWPGSASFDLEDERTVPELFSRKKSDFQVRYEQQKVPYAEQPVFERKGSECNDDEESERVSLQREYWCFKCLKTGHIARNCQVRPMACSKSAYEEKKLKKRTSEAALSAMIMEETKNTSKNMWIADWFMSCHVTNSLEGMYDIQEVT